MRNIKDKMINDKFNDNKRRKHENTTGLFHIGYFAILFRINTLFSTICGGIYSVTTVVCAYNFARDM